MIRFRLVVALALVAVGLVWFEKGRYKPSTPGDSPAQVPPLATDLSPDLDPSAVEKAMRKVADWQIERARSSFNLDWTFATLYAGLAAAGAELNEPKYTQAVYQFGQSRGWALGPRSGNADDQAVGQSYLELYFQNRDDKILAPLKAQFDRLKSAPDKPEAPTYWWCDALFMAPPVWAGLSKATGDRSYLDFMDRNWEITSKLLYDPDEHLFFRDSSYLDKREQNGRKLFWSRGNGWVIAGLARVLECMPQDYPDRPKYVEQFKQMAAKIVSLQGADGLWRSGLLDQQAYPLPENSGSAFYVYAFAWGVENGFLSKSAYMPAIKKGWAGLISHIYSDGRLGSIQPIGGSPAPFQASSSFVYGVGAFLLAGSEIHRLTSAPAQPANR